MEEQPQTTVNQNAEGNGLAVAGLVLGIIAVVLVFVPVLPYILGILAIIFGGVGIKKPVKTGMAKASIVLGIIAKIGRASCRERV